VAEIAYGIRAAIAHSHNKEIGVPIITNINISNECKIDLSTLRYYPMPENKYNKFILKKGDLLFNWRSGSKRHIGKTAIFNLDGKYTFSSFILRFRVKSIVNNLFLFYYLLNIKNKGYFEQNRNQSSVNSVFNASVSSKIPVILPPLKIQKKITSNLLMIDRKIEAEENKKKALEKLFKSMLHNLMSAKIRVNKISHNKLTDSY